LVELRFDKVISDWTIA